MALCQEMVKEVRAAREEGRIGLFRYIVNSHTKKLHNPNCSAIQMMKKGHIVYTNHVPKNYSQCGWCASKIYNQPEQTKLDHLVGD